MATERAIPALVPGQRVPMSYEEFLAVADEDVHAEWVDGEVIVFAPVSVRHQILQVWLTKVIGFFVDLFNLGEVCTAPLEMRVRLGGPSREPDILFVAREHREWLEAQRLNGPADLIVELISPESVRRDRIVKLREYAAAGVPEYWLIDTRPSPAAPVCYRLNSAGVYEPVEPDESGRIHSTVLPGFWLDPAWLTQDPLPKPLAIIRQIAPQALRAALEADE
jgi:Uma2 family endonuclease